MCAAAASRASLGVSQAQMKDAGLVDDHCYSIIDACVLKLGDGEKENLVKVRNPQGHFEWDGDWSDKSPLWTPKTKAQVKLVDKNDGTFWIAYKDYITFFYLTTICYLRDEYKSYTI